MEDRYSEEKSGPCLVCQTETTYSGSYTGDYPVWLCPDHGGKNPNLRCQFCWAEEKPTSSRPADHCKWVGSLSEKFKGRRSFYCYKRQITQLKAQIADLEKEKDEIYREAMSHHEAQTGDLNDRIKELDAKLELWRQYGIITKEWPKVMTESEVKAILNVVRELKAAKEWPE